MVTSTQILERLERIESHLAHVERQYDELNQVVIDQGKQLKKLQSQQRRLADSVEITETERIKATPAKPPHYQ